MNYGQRVLVWTKWKILRKYIKYRRTSKALTPPTEMQERVLLLWKLYTHYDESKLYYLGDSHTRQVDNEDLLLAYGVSGDNFVISVKNSSSCYEIQLTMAQADMAVEEFDREMRRRMKNTDQSKRSIIIKGLDSMIDVAQDRRDKNREGTPIINIDDTERQLITLA